MYNVCEMYVYMFVKSLCSVFYDACMMCVFYDICMACYACIYVYVRCVPQMYGMYVFMYLWCGHNVKCLYSACNMGCI